MCDCSTISWWLVGWRALHFLACLLPVGLLAFNLLVAAPVLRADSGPSRATNLSVLISLVLALVSGIAWLLLVAGSIGEVTPLEALRSGIVSAVLNQTHFGTTWRLRSVFWLIAATSSTVMLFRKQSSRGSTWICFVASAALLGALAWAGHGLDGNGNAAMFHVVADAAHLFVSAVWPVGLAPFAIALFMLQKQNNPSRWIDAAALTRRFSAVAIICVALLTLTGLINCWFMLPSFSSLWRSGYGRLLSVKIAVFVPMILFAGANRLALKPRLTAGTDVEATTVRLRRNVLTEFALCTVIILIVALLGLLMPPMP
jgi:putative copper resistance protein D